MKPCGLWWFLTIVLLLGMECLDTDLKEKLGIKLKRWGEADHDEVGRCRRRVKDGAATFMRSCMAGRFGT